MYLMGRGVQLPVVPVREGLRDISHCGGCQRDQSKHDDAAYHSRSDVEALSGTTGTCSVCSGSPFTGSLTSPATSDASANCFKRSLASALRSAGFLTFTALAGNGCGPRRFLFMQNTQRLQWCVSTSTRSGGCDGTYKGAKTTTTNTGIRNANAVGVMPLCPTVLLHSLFSRLANAS